MKTTQLGPLALVGFVVFGFSNVTRGQLRPTLEVPAIDPLRNITLSLHGEPGTNYAIEVSRSLDHWLPLTSATATIGPINFQYSPGTNAQTLYFRGRVDVALPPIMLSVQTDTNNQTVTLITPDDGGALSLMDTHGITYTLTVPPQAVSESQIVNMTVVTNLGRLPFAAGLLGGIAFTPSDLQFLGAAQLNIQFPTNRPTDPHLVITYAYDSDGSYLRLIPTMPTNNGVVAPILSLSGFGCSVATLDEISQQGQRIVVDTNVAALNLELKKSKPKGRFYDSCYPAEKTRATFVAKGLENAHRVASQAAAEKMAANAQLSEDDQLSGDELDLTGNFNNFYNDNLAQYLTEMQGNCPLASVVFTYLLGNARQTELLGIVSQIPDGFEHLCALFPECARKIGECCKTKGADQAAVVELLGLSRQWQLIGCDTSDPWQYIKDCLPLWYGTLKYEDTHTFASISANPENDFQYRLTATLIPTNLVGSPTGQGYYGLSGTVEGTADGSYRNHTRATGTCCYCFSDTLETSAVSADVKALFQLVWSITNTPPAGPKIGLLLFPNLASLPALGSADSLHTATDSHGDADCNQVLDITTSHGTFAYPLQNVIYNSQSITGTVNDVVGTYRTNWTAGDGSQWTRQVSWDLHRQQGF